MPPENEVELNPIPGTLAPTVVADQEVATPSKSN
jgi:hypothetical protein